MRNCIEYVLKEQKITDGLVYMTGPAPEIITWDTVYQSFLEEKRLWDKDSGRMYNHNIISFHKDEEITPEQAFEMGKEFAEKWFPNHQTLLSVHQDRDHTHIHFVTNTVSYIDGMKLHNSRADLQKMKDFTNEMCKDRGLTIAEKGKHFDGTVIEEGTTIAWSKDKYHLMENESKKSYVVDCAIAVMEAKEISCNREEFIGAMRERGWNTTWTENKKHITFENDNGDKVRDSNISKSFSIDISKEVLLNEFERQNELRLAKLKAERDKADERERAEQLNKYYAEIEAAIQGNGASGEAVIGIEASNGGEGQPSEGRETDRPETDTEALIRDTRADISDSRTQDRTIRDTEKQSVALDKQSHTREAERRAEERARVAAEERAKEASRRAYHRSEPSR